MYQAYSGNSLSACFDTELYYSRILISIALFKPMGIERLNAAVPSFAMSKYAQLTKEIKMRKVTQDEIGHVSGGMVGSQGDIAASVSQFLDSLTSVIEIVKTNGWGSFVDSLQSLLGKGNDANSPAIDTYKPEIATKIDNLH